MLVLFDIDGTLLSSEGAGVRAMTQAGQALYGEGFSLKGLSIGGRLDSLIFADACAAADITDASEERFRATYAATLPGVLMEVTVEALPGVKTLLDVLEDRGAALGLVTGNYPETGRMKLEAAGIDPGRFGPSAWGTDGASRDELPPAALAAWSGDASGAALVGDTIHDVTSGQAAGLRVLAVCTGSHERQLLAESGPDLLLDDLGDTLAIVQWLMQEEAP